MSHVQQSQVSGSVRRRAQHTSHHNVNRKKERKLQIIAVQTEDSHRPSDQNCCFSCMWFPTSFVHLRAVVVFVLQILEKNDVSPFHSNCLHEFMQLVSSHASQPREVGRGTPLCGPPLRRSTEHGGSAVRAALAANPSGSSARCGASFVRRSRSQRHRSRRRRRAFMWCARSSNGPPGQSLDGTDAGTFDSAGSGLGHSPFSKTSFSEALDVTGCGVEPIPISRKSVSMHHKISCHLGHHLKRRRAPNEYECDVCDKDVSTSKRFFDCRKCNCCVCQM